MKSSTQFRAILSASLVTMVTVTQVIGHASLEAPRARLPGTYCCGNRGDGVGKSQPTVPGLNCGLCGEDKDVLSSEGVWRPRDSEFDGKYGRSGPVAVYTEGQWMDISVGVPNTHGFYMEFRLSPNPSWERSRNQKAFSYLLKVELTKYSPTQNLSDPAIIPHVSQDPRFPTRINVNQNDGSAVWLDAKLKLPTGLICENCVIQFNYRGRAQESFRSCSDIRIIPTENTDAPYDLLVNEETGLCLKTDDAWSILKLAQCDPNDRYQSMIRFQSWEDYNKRNNKLAIRATALCLDVYSNASTNGAQIGMYSCNVKLYDMNQRFGFEKTDDGSAFRIVGQASGLYLSVVKKTGKFVVNSKSEDHYQLWTILPSQVTQDNIPAEVNRPMIQNGIAYCPGRESGTPEGCWDIPRTELTPTSKFTRLMNIETGKCLRRNEENPLTLVTCDSNDPLQSVTLFQLWAEYEGWNHGIGLSSTTSCIDFKQEWWESGQGNAVLARDCLLSMNDYRENQFWGTRPIDNGQSFQIFSQSTGYCLSVERQSKEAFLDVCYDKTTISPEYQYWILVDYPTIPK